MSAPIDAPLTAEEEARFAGLFADSQRLSLADGWQAALRGAIDSHAASSADAPVVEPVTLDAIRAERRRRNRNRLLYAAVVAAIVGLAGLLFVSIGSDGEGGIESIDGVGPSLDLGAPTITDLPAPPGAIGAAPFADGVVAWSEDRVSGTTTFFSTVDGSAWAEVGTLPIVDAVVGESATSLLAVGANPDSMVPVPGLRGYEVATELSVVESFDGGDTWSTRAVVLDGQRRADTEWVMQFPSVTRSGEVLAVSYNWYALFDPAPALRAAGYITERDEAVVVFDRGNAAVIGVGPDTFGRLDISRTDELLVAQSGAELLGPAQQTIGVQVAVGDAPLRPTEDLPTDDGDSLWALHGPIAVLGPVDGGVAVALPGRSKVFVTGSGESWRATDPEALGLVPEAEGTVDWQIRMQDWSRITQSVRGGTFRNPPIDLEGRVGSSTHRTWFGWVGFWHTTSDLFEAAPVDVFEESGYRVEFGPAPEWTVFDPAGEPVVEGADLFRPNGSAGELVVPDLLGGLQLFSETGERLVNIDPREAHGPAWERGFPTLLGWSSNAADWKSVEPDVGEGGNWVFSPIDDGLLAVGDFDDAVRVLTLTWPQPDDG